MLCLQGVIIRYTKIFFWRNQCVKLITASGHKIYVEKRQSMTKRSTALLFSSLPLWTLKLCVFNGLTTPSSPTSCTFLLDVALGFVLHASQTRKEASVSQLITLDIQCLGESDLASKHFPGSPVVKTSPASTRIACLILGQGSKIPHALQPRNQNLKQKQYCNKFNKDFKDGPHQKNL